MCPYHLILLFINLPSRLFHFLFCCFSVSRNIFSAASLLVPALFHIFHTTGACSNNASNFFSETANPCSGIN
jgi:hypothetical protein